ncbi:UDP-N-acetylmuramate dehydrogenase [Gammaproteobacteria bacterium]|nr:UDP-N-acetylmuramate dehydrogenase [Gammaproteobacteria bacterium]
MIIESNQPILNSLKLCSIAKESVVVKNTNELHEIYKHIKNNNLRYLVLGEGTNIIPPEFFDGIIIKSNFNSISFKSPKIINVGSAVNWDDLVQFTLQNSIKGFENLSLIPGSVGASPIQNIGAYGADVSSLIDSVECFDLKKNKLIHLTNTECDFSYRSSALKNSSLFIQSINFRVDESRVLNSEYKSIKAYMSSNDIGVNQLTSDSLSKIVTDIRKSVLPNHNKIFNAGSFFKNPVINKDIINFHVHKESELVIWDIDNNLVKVGAARLIELIKDEIPPSENVFLYHKHALVLVTNGKANQSEVLLYAKSIQDKVQTTFNIKLDIEPNIIY